MVAPADQAPQSAKRPCHDKTKRINYTLAATLITAGMSYEDAARQTGAANGESLRRGLHRKGVTKRQATSITIQGDRIATVTRQVATEASEIIRNQLGDKLGQAVTALGGKRVSYKDLANQGQGHAAVLKTLAETHKTLYGGAEMNVVVFGVGSMDATPGPQAIEVQSQVQPSESE